MRATALMISVDGNINGDRTTTHTDYEPNTCWQVDLESSYTAIRQTTRALKPKPSSLSSKNST
jgi:hypothetical protein